MHPPQHVLKKIEEINPNVRLGWTQRRYAGAPQDGAFAVLDLYPKALADNTFEALWENSGPVFGTAYDPLARVPVIKSWMAPEQVFSGAVIDWVRRTSWRDKAFRQYIRQRNEALAQARRYDRQQMAGEIGEELYWRAHRSADPAPTIPDIDVTADDKARLDGSWEQGKEEAVVGVSGVGMT